ncbi:hypothetical protein C8R43DRAFT_1116231 [Mycena crocata]|nr:hypothetical protein C8R43DRAFT_1116231 [Mycena crocata]
MADELPPSYGDSFLDEKDDSSSRYSSSALTLNNKNTPSSPDALSTSITPSSLLLQRGASRPSSTTRSINPTGLAGLLNIFRKRRHTEISPASSIEAAVMEDVRILIQPNSGSVAEQVALLESCAELCARHKVDFPLLLQEKRIGNHAVLYWAIVNSPWPPRAPYGLVSAVLSHSSPLKPETIQEARRACVSLHSHEMFNFLCLSPTFGALSDEDRLLVGYLVPPEEIVVEAMAGPAEPFSVKFTIPLYQKRMLLGREIKLEFIARGRLWQLSFFTADKPTQPWLRDQHWSGSLRLVATPEPAWVYGASDKVLRASSAPGNGTTTRSWQMFGNDSVCIAPDGSIAGILGVKLRVALAQTPRTDWPKKIPTTADADADCISEALSILLINGPNLNLLGARAYTHTSVAIRDAFLGVGIPFIEVHVSNVHAREAFRHHSYLSDKEVVVIVGLGVKGYGN